MPRSLWTRWLIALCLTGTLSACPLEKKTADGGTSHSDGGTRKDAAVDEEDPDAGADKPDAGSTGGSDAGKDASVTADSGTKSDAGTDAGPKTDGGTSTGTTPVLSSATARQSGRFGADLRVDVVGTDPDGDAVTLRLSAFDKSGKPVNVGDTDGDNKPDVGPLAVPLAAALGTGANATGYAVVAGLYGTNNGIDHVDVTLVDSAGLASDKVTATVEAQSVLGGSALCDATYVMNRCADGFGCKGAVPTTCQAGEAPKLTRVAYLSDDLGTRILVEGTDVDLDAKRFKLEFLNAGGNAVMIDTDSDPGNVPDADHIERDITDLSWDGTKFFFRLDQGETFATTVAKVRVTVMDRGNLASAPMTADKTTAPIRSAGQTCDARTFDRCAAGTVCISANAGKSYSCTANATARMKACTAALTLDPGHGIKTVRGNVVPPSLWDPPTGCVPNDPTNQPEAVVKLVLSMPAAKVTLSTNNVYTAFSSTLYMMAKCDDAPVVAWCQDFNKTNGAELVLTSIAAGTYYVFVDSLNTTLTGTTFQLDVAVE